MQTRRGVSQKGSGQPPPRSRLLIAATPLAAEALAQLLEDIFDVIGPVINLDLLAEASLRTVPDIILCEVASVHHALVQIVLKIKRDQPAMKIVFLTQTINDVDRTLTLQVGAAGCISTMLSGAELRRSLWQALQGRKFVAPEFGKPEVSLATADPIAKLTKRQQEVLQLVATGRTRKQIAEILNVSAKTVEFHKTRIMDQLELRTTAELVRYVLLQPAMEPPDLDS
jgi:DNA-binding NarL/FixJ family response regulator